MESFKVFGAAAAGFIAGGFVGCIVGLALSIPFLGMIMVLTVPICGVIGAWKGAVMASEAVGKREYGSQVKNYLLTPNKTAELLVIVPLLLFFLFVFLEERLPK